MSLGQLYEPSGKALEHARSVLEVDDPYAVNVAYGCSRGCTYCYGPQSTFQSRGDWMDVRHPDEDPFELVRGQVEGGLDPDGVFISFLTEPLLPSIENTTEEIAEFLIDRGIKVAVLSKLATCSVSGVRHGMTIISLDEGFWEKHEGKTTPPEKRVEMLKNKADEGEYTWVSMEPCPCSNIWEQDITELLSEIDFVDFIVKGKWNYDSRAETEEMRGEYGKIINKFEDYCESAGIRHHVKKGTRRFISGD